MNPIVKALVPVRDQLIPIMSGPFRGGTFFGSPRHSIRKMLGVYEYELNGWIRAALHEADGLLDLGANDGYFTFGCAAAFARSGRRCQIACFEPDPHYAGVLRRAARRYDGTKVQIDVHQKFVRSVARDEAAVTLAKVTLDRLEPDARVLVKIDIEGAELDVLKAAGSWLAPRSLFVIEVHSWSLLQPIVDLARDAGLVFDQIDQRPHWLFGCEQRDADNRWLVSRLEPGRARRR